MPKLSAAQIAKYASDAGIRDKAALTRAVAIALGESSGNTDAVGDVALQNSTWGPSIGLWQVRSLNADKGKGTVRDETRLRDPAFNARAMVSISNGGTNWQPWTVNNTGAYLLHMPAATAGVNSMGGVTGNRGPIDDFADGVVDGFTGGASNALDSASMTAASLRAIPESLDATYGWISNRQNWIRVAQVVIGGVVIVAGVAYISKGTIVNTVAGTAATVVKKGLK